MKKMWTVDYSVQWYIPYFATFIKIDQKLRPITVQKFYTTTNYHKTKYSGIIYYSPSEDFLKRHLVANTIDCEIFCSRLQFVNDQCVFHYILHFDRFDMTGHCKPYGIRTTRHIKIYIREILSENPFLYTIRNYKNSTNNEYRRFVIIQRVLTNNG